MIDVNEDSIEETTGAAHVRRIFKWDFQEKEKISTTTVVLSFTCPREEVQTRIEIGYLSFKTRHVSSETGFKHDSQIQIQIR